MIRLQPRPPEPEYLGSNAVRKTIDELELKVEAGQAISSSDFPSYWLNENVREPLFTLHKGKCCYCERKRDMKRESDIDHYRPKAAVTEDAEHLGYWWLAYKWSNYLFSCKRCNQSNKKSHFPLLAGSFRASSPEDELADEQPVIINPIDDDPENYLSYDWRDGGGVYVKMTGTDCQQRGTRTIDILGLNEASLMEERATDFSLLTLVANTMSDAKTQSKTLAEGDDAEEVANAAQLIFEQTSAGKPFAAFRREYFRKLGFGEYVATD